MSTQADAVSNTSVAAIAGDEWGAYQKLTAALCGIVIILDGIDVLVMGIAAPALLAEWGITKADLAPALASGLFGMMIGAILGGGIGDKGGRRPALICATLTFALFTIAMVAAGNVSTLALLRFVAGLGLGAALPNATALVSELTPLRYRALAVSLLITCVPLGGVFAGFVGSIVLPAQGWRGLFWIAGLLPLAMGVVLMRYLPESPLYLAATGRRDKLHALMAKLGHVGSEPAAADEKVGAATTSETSRVSLWSKTQRRETIGICAAFFFCLSAVYLFYSWLPTLLTEYGRDIASASRMLSILNVGAVIGALAFGSLFSRFGSKALLLAAILIGTIVTAGMAAFPRVLVASDFVLGAVIMLQGVAIVGLQVLLYPLAAHIFPIAIRATGLGLAIGLGRVGAVTSVSAGAGILAGGAVSFFSTVVACLLLTGATLFVVRRHIEPTIR